MGTAVAPINTSSVIDVDLMIKQMDDELVKFYHDVQHGEGIKAMRPRWERGEYIRRVIDKHVDMLEVFGGWRYHTKPFDSMPLAPAEIKRIIEEVAVEWQRGATLYKNEKGRAPEKVPALNIKKWASEAEALFCEVNGCHLPWPNPDAASLWRTREYLAGAGAKEAEEQYAVKTYVKVRTGQVPTRAILAEVRRTFKNHPNYIKMYEILCERIGVAWAASKGLPITLSFAPVDFLRCGHYGEAGSCYRSGSQQEHSKYNLSVVQNSAMTLFYKENVEQQSALQLRPAKAIGRCWSVLDMENGGGLFSNIYLVNWDTARTSVEAALQQAFGWKVQGGMQTGDALKNFQTYAYTNGDHNIFATPQSLPKVQAGIREQLNLLEKIRHNRTPCASCGTPYGHQDMLSLCGCRRHICPECVTETTCCKQKICKNCTPKQVKCGGCAKITCGKCKDGNKLTVCRDTGVSYCIDCAKDRLTSCKYCSNYTTKPVMCNVSKTAACPTCSKEYFRSCNRCNESVILDHITRCSGCKERRCDNCAKEGEERTPKALCGKCQEGGIEKKDTPLDPEVLKQLQASLDKLAPDVRDKFVKKMREFTWDIDDIDGR